MHKITVLPISAIVVCLAAVAAVNAEGDYRIYLPISQSAPPGTPTGSSTPTPEATATITVTPTSTPGGNRCNGAESVKNWRLQSDIDFNYAWDDPRNDQDFRNGHQHFSSDWTLNFEGPGSTGPPRGGWRRDPAPEFEERRVWTVYTIGDQQTQGAVNARIVNANESFSNGNRGDYSSTTMSGSDAGETTLVSLHLDLVTCEWKLEIQEAGFMIGNEVIHTEIGDVTRQNVYYRVPDLVGAWRMDAITGTRDIAVPVYMGGSRIRAFDFVMADFLSSFDQGGLNDLMKTTPVTTASVIWTLSAIP